MTDPRGSAVERRLQFRPVTDSSGSRMLPPSGLRMASRDLAAVLLAVEAAVSSFDLDFGLRHGVILCVLALVLSLHDVRFRSADVVAIAFAGLSVASFAWTISPATTRTNAANIAAGAIIFIAVRTVSRSRRCWRIIAGGLVVGAVYAVYRLYTENALQARLTFDLQSDRFGLEGVNPNYLAYAIVTTSMVLWLLWLSSAKPGRWILPVLGVTVISYMGVLVAGSRGALIAAILSLLWVGWHFVIRPSEKSHRLALLLVGLVALEAAIVSGRFERLISGILQQSVRERGDLNGRFVLWPAAWDWWTRHPLLGTGAGTFADVSPIPGVPAHNFVLDIGTGVGILGVFMFLWLLSQALIVETRRHRCRSIVVGSYALVSAPMLFSGFWYQSPVFWLSLGLVTTIFEALPHFEGHGVPLDGTDPRVLNPAPRSSSRSRERYLRM